MNRNTEKKIKWLHMSCKKSIKLYTRYELINRFYLLMDKSKMCIAQNMILHMTKHFSLLYPHQ